MPPAVAVDVFNGAHRNIDRSAKKTENWSPKQTPANLVVCVVNEQSNVIVLWGRDDVPCIVCETIGPRFISNADRGLGRGWPYHLILKYMSYKKPSCFCEAVRR